MAVPDDKTTLHIVVDREIKEKLQILADRDVRKLSNYVSRILDNYVSDYEDAILQKYGFEEFDKYFYHIFGHGIEHHKRTQINLIIDQTVHGQESDVGFKVNLDEILDDVDVEHAKKQMETMSQEISNIKNSKTKNNKNSGFRVIKVKPDAPLRGTRLKVDDVEFDKDDKK